MRATINTLSSEFKKCRQSHFTTYASEMSAVLWALCNIKLLNANLRKRETAMRKLVCSLFAGKEKRMLRRMLKHVCSDNAFALYDILRRYCDGNSFDTNILSCSVERLADIQREVESSFGKDLNLIPKEEKSAIFNLLKRIFDYDAFREGKVLELGKDGAVRWRQCKANSWSGGDFVRILNPVVKYCPYCNADTIYAVKICGRRVLPSASALDHFMPRSHFPYFGISLCNLVPSCTRCNSSLKGDSVVTFADAPHPYRDNVYGNFRFYVTAHSITSIGQDCDFDIFVKYRGGMAQQNKAKHLFDDVLHIGDVYDQLFKRETLDIIKKLRLLTKPYIKGVFSGLLSSNNDLKCLLPELLVPNDCIPTYRFSKLTKDMAVQFGVMARALFGG